MNLHCPVIRRWEERYRANTALLERLLGEIRADEAARRPAVDSWSAAECLAHLNRSAATYLERMEPAAEEARRQERAGRAPYARGPWAGRLILWVLDPRRQEKRRAPAPGAFRPPQEPPPLETLGQDFRRLQRRFHALLARADGLDLGKVIFATPVSPLVRVSLAQAFEIHARHQPRHLAQARRAVESVRRSSA